MSTATARKARGVSFFKPMVTAVLERRKRKTRRAFTPQPDPELPASELTVERYHPAIDRDGFMDDGPEIFGAYCDEDGWQSPFGGPGDLLWVKEALMPDESGLVVYQQDGSLAFREGEPVLWPWKPKKLGAMYMPRWASRITLEVEDVDAERLCDITEADALEEGFVRLPASGRVVLQNGDQYFGNVWPSARQGFFDVWDHLNAPRGLTVASNPMVWVISFDVVDGRG